MSLEDALNRNTEALTKQSELIEKMLGAAAARTGGTTASAGSGDTDAGEGATTPPKKPGRPKKTDASNDTSGAVTFDELKAKILAWLGEFAKAEDKDNPEGTHPEVTARKAALQKAYGSEKLKIEKLPEIKDNAEKIAILNDWFETKVKTVDKGFGVGRLVADPEPETEASDDDGMDI